MDELWFNYQRLKDVTANLKIKDNVVNILSAKMKIWMQTVIITLRLVI